MKRLGNASTISCVREYVRRGGWVKIVRGGGRVMGGTGGCEVHRGNGRQIFVFSGN